MEFDRPSRETVRQFVADIQQANPEGAQQASVSVAQLAEQWGALGLRPGDLVALAMPNGARLLGHFFAVLEAGLVPALVAPGLPVSRLQETLRSLSARALVAPRLDPAAFNVASATSVGADEVIALEPDGLGQTNAGEVVLLTSGTSGFSSGCVFTVDQLLLNAHRHADAIGLRPDDRLLVSLPLYFSYALVAQALAALTRGAELVVSGPPFHAPSVFDWLGRHRITVSSLTPLLVRTLLQQQAAFPLSLRALTVGGDSLAPHQVSQLLKQRPDGELYLTYGLTEAGPRVATLAAHQEPPQRYASVGLPLEGVETRLEPRGEAPGEQELLVRSATVMSRRIGLVEGRRNGLRADGFLATGDVFSTDEEGYLYFRRRLGDFLLRGGEKICLASIRRIATSLPGVLAATTEVLSQATGEADFDLRITLSGSPDRHADTIPSQLRKLLRRHELPRRIHLSTAGAESLHK